MTQQKTALITGITGQDGSYLADTSNLVRIVQETPQRETTAFGLAVTKVARHCERSKPRHCERSAAIQGPWIATALRASR